jgi:hypothetical protein
MGVEEELQAISLATVSVDLSAALGGCRSGRARSFTRRAPSVDAAAAMLHVSSMRSDRSTLWVARVCGGGCREKSAVCPHEMGDTAAKAALAADRAASISGVERPLRAMASP